MNGKSRVAATGDSQIASAEQRLKELDIKLPTPPEPFGTYAEAVRTGNLLFLTGMLPTEGHSAKFIGRLGAELDVQAARGCRPTRGSQRPSCHTPTSRLSRSSNAHCPAGVSIATVGDVRDQPKVADGASELLQSVFGKEEEPLPIGLRCCKPSARHAGGTRSHLRGCGVKYSEPVQSPSRDNLASRRRVMKILK